MSSNTQQKLAQEDSAPIFELTFNLINQVDNGIILIDRQFQVILWNDWTSKMAHKSKTQVIGVSLFKLFPLIMNTALETAIHEVFSQQNTCRLTHEDYGYLFPLYSNDKETGQSPVAHDIVVKPISSGPGSQYCLLEVFDQSQLSKLRLAHHNQSLELSALSSDANRFSSLYDQLMNSSYTGILKTDSKGRIDSCNVTFTRLFGYAKDQLQDITLAGLIQVQKGQAVESFDALLTVPDDHVVYLNDLNKHYVPVNIRIAKDESITENRYTVFICDLSKQYQSQVELENEKSRAEAALESIADAVVTCNRQGAITYMNSAARQLTAWSQQEATGAPLHKIINLCDEETLAPIFLSDMVKSDKEIQEYPKYCNALLIRRDHLKISIEYSLSPLRQSSSRQAGLVIVLHDISRARDYARKLAWQSSHDSLTGLVNRVEFERRIEQLLASAKENETEHAFIYIDIDQFKVINNTCGHLAGDELLRQFSDILKSKLNPNDIIARLGGDEFGILMTNCLSAVAQQTAQQIITALDEFRFNWNGQSFAIDTSMSIVEINKESDSTIQILSTADTACATVKHNGRNHVAVYNKETDAIDQHRGEMRWVSRIQRALDWDEIELYCQPIVPLHPANHDQKRVEVLVRLKEKSGIVMPNEFIPAAERFNLMPKIDRKVVDKTLDLLQQETIELLDPININLSGLSISNENFLYYLIEKVSRSKVDPNLLCFEITETAAIQNISAAANFMTVLKKMGCQFALDDFGSGLSSFSYLKTLPIDYLKIDGYFVKEMHKNPVDHATVEAINQIGHVMGIQTIAEFVEDEDTLNKLRELGIDFAQGFHIDKPKPLTEYLQKRKPK